MLAFCAVPKLTKSVPAPALDSPSASERTTKFPARNNLDYSTGQSAYVNGCIAINCSAIAELAVAVATPALDSPSASERTGVRLIRRDGNDPVCQSHHVCWGGTVSASRAVPKLTLLVVSPALDTTTICESASMI